jgi:hypothetical protein
MKKKPDPYASQMRTYSMGAALRAGRSAACTESAQAKLADARKAAGVRPFEISSSQPCQRRFGHADFSDFHPAIAVSPKKKPRS